MCSVVGSLLYVRGLMGCKKRVIWAVNHTSGMKKNEEQRAARVTRITFTLRARVLLRETRLNLISIPKA